MQIGKATDLGMVRKQNEDSIYIGQPFRHMTYAIVADGMGGHKAGEVASAMAVEKISSYINSHCKSDMAVDDIRSVIAEAFFAANDAIYQESLNESHHGMGTTASLCFMKEDSVIISHVGDSRIYYMDADVHQLTRDHSLVADLVERGEITNDEAKVDPRKNVITRALGTERIISIDLGIYDYTGEIILLCSDGLTNFVSEEEILQVVREEENLQKSCDRLVALANAHGGKDNISVIMLKK